MDGRRKIRCGREKNGMMEGMKEENDGKNEGGK